ncbi:MAG: aldehyde ferredoxin oxidoreductase, partial [Deltaproteobacteria bacterium]|nr:aldehyde ferredoxin oxidoreductase [Deltaproteobacteria bacterium]
MDRILRIDVGAEGGPKATVEPVGRYATLGGRAMTSTVVWEEVPADCDPLGPQNKLVLSPGIMSGSAATTSGRLSVGCKSPLTGGIKEANAGGQAAQHLARLGYAAVILEGVTKDLYKILINKDGVKISPCGDLRMLGNYAVAEKIKAEHGDKVAMVSIGPAGEQFLANSSVAVTDMEFRPTRHAARGGVGAVMGSKGIKVIVVDAEGVPMRQPVHPEAFKEANKKLIETLRASEVTGMGLPGFGTAMVADIVNEVGGYPAMGARQGQWDGVAKINGPAIATLENERGGEGTATHGCHTG